MIEEGANHLLEAVEGRVETLLGELREGREQLSALQSRLQVLEAERLELREENRELDEQNRELEDHNRDLHERLAAGESGSTAYSLPPRRARGLSALMGHRPRATRTLGPGAGTPPAAPAESVTKPDSPPDTSPADASPADASPVDASSADADPCAPSDGPAQGDLAIGEAPSAQALLEQWYQRYDATFFKGHTRPLKVGIHEDLVAREPWPERLVRRALACYVNLPRYLKAVRDGAPRIDLGGEPAGTVDQAAAEHARKKLERLQAQRRQRSAAGGKPNADKPEKADAGKVGKADAGKPNKPDAGKVGKADVGKAGKAAAPIKPSGAEPEAPATLDEKLSALLAKHNGREG